MQYLAVGLIHLALDPNGTADQPPGGEPALSPGYNTLGVGAEWDYMLHLSHLIVGDHLPSDSVLEAHSRPLILLDTVQHIRGQQTVGDSHIWKQVEPQVVLSLSDLIPPRNRKNLTYSLTYNFWLYVSIVSLSITLYYPCTQVLHLQKWETCSESSQNAAQHNNITIHG